MLVVQASNDQRGRGQSRLSRSAAKSSSASLSRVSLAAVMAVSPCVAATGSAGAPSASYSIGLLVGGSHWSGIETYPWKDSRLLVGGLGCRAGDTGLALLQRHGSWRRENVVKRHRLARFHQRGSLSDRPEGAPTGRPALDQGRWLSICELSRTVAIGPPSAMPKGDQSCGSAYDVTVRGAYTAWQPSGLRPDGRIFILHESALGSALSVCKRGHSTDAPVRQLRGLGPCGAQSHGPRLTRASPRRRTAPDEHRERTKSGGPVQGGGDLTGAAKDDA